MNQDQLEKRLSAMERQLRTQDDELRALRAVTSIVHVRIKRSIRGWSLESVCWIGTAAQHFAQNRVFECPQCPAGMPHDVELFLAIPPQGAP